ncbi:hypothetical protein CK203_006485 [Vitis vinifera]|uniref:Reverse transcriptase domain-containing protein n=1 Tax=Vitis vinifera TaxID=29760 RepID=A0A438KAP0_VITVI|nr:hypothetical protein CK203_006485 [Vitis vinifera]
MRLASSEAEGLEIHFSKEGVFVALIDPGKDKARGLYHDFLVVLLGCVPKKGGAEDLKDFRLISLVGSLYKLLANVLANRIKKVMGKVISESQNAFVEGRQILDAVLIANEVVDSRSKELRQGDPLSPYLFVIAMEVFSCLLRRAISGGFLYGWRVRGRSGQGTPISHLLFADDTLVFCEESLDQMTYLSWLLMWFEACSGLKINLEKSELILVGKVHDIEDLALELGCKVGGLLSCYLGLPLGPPSNQWLCGMVLKSVFIEGLQCGRGSVRNLALMNNTLLSKWNWRFANEREAFWRRVISHKYGEEEGGWRTRANAWVSDVWNPIGNGDDWTPFFSRAFNNWEIELVEHFLHRIQAFQVQREEEDRVFWTESKCGAFSIKSLYSILEPRGSSVFPSDNIWKVRVPPKITFFAWEASCGPVESLLFSLFGVTWTLSCTVKETLLGGMERLWGKFERRLGKWPLYVYFAINDLSLLKFDQPSSQREASSELEQQQNEGNENGQQQQQQLESTLGFGSLDLEPEKNDKVVENDTETGKTPLAYSRRKWDNVIDPISLSHSQSSTPETDTHIPCLLQVLSLNLT